MLHRAQLLGHMGAGEHATEPDPQDLPGSADIETEAPTKLVDECSQQYIHTIQKVETTQKSIN